MALLALAVILLLITVPGALLVQALGTRSPRGAVRAVEAVGLSVALSLGILVLVGTVLGHYGLYRFASTGAPVVEGVLLLLVGALAAVALRGRARARRSAAPEAW